MPKERSFFRHGMAKWGLFMFALFALWFGGWFVVANWTDGQVGTVVTRLEQRGISIGCTNREVHGFPFRLGLRCDEAAVDDSVHQYSLQTGAIRSAAQIYAPRQNVVEVDGPLVFESVTASINADWESMRFYIDANRSGFDLLSTNFRKLEAAFNDLVVEARTGAVHFRPAPKKPDTISTEHVDLDFAATLEAVLFSDNAGEPVDIVADVDIGRGYSDFITKRRPPREWLKDGADIGVRTLALTTPDGGRLAFVGPLKLHSDGSLSGTVKVGVENRDELARWIAEVNPELGPIITALGQGIALLGREETLAGRKMTVLDVDLDHGKASVGLVPLGEIAPLVFD